MIVVLLVVRGRHLRPFREAAGGPRAADQQLEEEHAQPGVGGALPHAHRDLDPTRPVQTGAQSEALREDCCQQSVLAPIPMTSASLYFATWFDQCKQGSPVVCSRLALVERLSSVLSSGMKHAHLTVVCALQVFDYDRFSASDPLGSATLDLAPLRGKGRQERVLELTGVPTGRIRVAVDIEEIEGPAGEALDYN